LLCDIVDDLRDHIERFRRANALVPVRRAFALEEHRRILNALEKGDAKLARERMETHILGALKVVLAQLDGKQVDTRFGLGGLER
jgi:DNA-binding GntR family transcriptional regulator